MANPTTNYGFIMPTPTDLVTDLPADFGVFGQAVDTQMLTNANAAIAKTIVDAKGDLIAATAADTVSRLAVGTNGQYLQADSTAATGLKWASVGGAGIGFVSTDTFSAVTTLSLNSKFTSTYENYRVYVDFTNGGGTQSLLMRMRASGTDTTSSLYGYYSPVGTWSGSAAAEGRIGTVPPSGSTAQIVMDVSRPFDTKITKITGLYVFTSGSSIGEVSQFAMVLNNTTSYDGFTIYSGGNSFTGRVTIYGYSLS
jgi:hypothetical protein